MCAFIKDYQDLISGIFTLIAGAAAYFAVLRQIRADKEQFNQIRKEKEVAFLTIISGSLRSYQASLNMLEHEILGIRDDLPRGVDLRRSIPDLIRAVSFDLDMLKSWQEYVTFDRETIEKIREFYDAYVALSNALDLLRSIVVPSEMPLLRIIGKDDEAEIIRPRLSAI